MKYPVFFRDEAKIDFLDACAWYAKEQAALNDRCSAAVERALDFTSSSPQQYPLIYRDIRRILIRSFPYGLFYRFQNDEIEVIAVTHASRDSTVWTSRIADDQN